VPICMRVFGMWPIRIVGCAMFRILVVSDNETIESRKLCTIVEGESGWRVTWAPRPEEVPRCLEQQAPDLILVFIPPDDGSQRLGFLTNLLSDLRLRVPVVPVICGIL